MSPTRSLRSSLLPALLGMLWWAPGAHAEVARVSIKLVAGPDGQPNDFWSLDRVLQWMDDVNRIYETHTAIRFDLIEIRTIQPPSTPFSWSAVIPYYTTFMEDQASSDPSMFYWRTDAINVFLVDEIVGAGGLCSFSDGLHQEIIFVEPGIADGSVGLAHELGHYLNLRHTHANFEGASGGCAGYFAGDCVADTPNDINPGFCSSLFSPFPNPTVCKTTLLAALYGAGSGSYKTLFYNVMSYHGPRTPIDALLTPGQAERALDTLLDERSHVLAEPGTAFRHYYFGDFDGDGRTDVFRYMLGAGEVVYLSNGSAFTYAGAWKAAGNGIGPKGFYVGDFDGDGKDDVMRYRLSAGGSPQVEVMLSTGSSFGPVLVWANCDIADGNGGFYVADYNGDGRDDVMRWISGIGCDVWISNGAAFVPIGAWSGAGQGQGAGFFPGDFNGDGRADLARQHTSSLPDLDTDVRLSTGANFQSFGYWTDAEFAETAKLGWYVGDFDGNGSDDIFRYVAGSSGAEMQLSTGWTFQPAGSWTGAGYGSGAYGWHVGDFNGDGKDDLYRVTFSASNIYLSTGASFKKPSDYAGPVYDPMHLDVTLSGNGKTTLQLAGMPSTTIVGLVMLSASPPELLAQGSFLGFNFDALTASLLASPPSSANPFFFVPPMVPGVFPAGPLTIPAGAFPAGLTLDFMVAVLVPGDDPIVASNVVRKTY